MSALDERVRSLLENRDVGAATTLVLRELGPEVLGFLYGVLGETDAEEVFAALCERLWLSLTGFEGRCSLRTWFYVLARHEISRFRKGARKHEAGRVPISGLSDALEDVRTRTRTMVTEHRAELAHLAKLRASLSEEDRTLLILRVDRNLAWDEIALAFADHPELMNEDGRKREAARLRKRFQLIKERLRRHVRSADRPRP